MLFRRCVTLQNAYNEVSFGVVVCAGGEGDDFIGGRNLDIVAHLACKRGRVKTVGKEFYIIIIVIEIKRV